mmetsp:Transcript_4724/g.9545  ORF Transcript_4724/g.9545 Transcript_4724/m.9545 type:complete len:113 (-) Transcript_4724:205-543(-)
MDECHKSGWIVAADETKRDFDFSNPLERLLFIEQGSFLTSAVGPHYQTSENHPPPPPDGSLGSRSFSCCWSVLLLAWTPMLIVSSFSVMNGILDENRSQVSPRDHFDVIQRF